MLPTAKTQNNTRSGSITFVSLFLLVFSVCSWTLAANIIESDVLSPLTTPGADLETPTGALSEPYSNRPDGPWPNQEPEPVDMPLFPALSYSTAILRGLTTENKQVALTFDDGPLPGWTEQYLAVLAEHEVPATFFAVGRFAQHYGHLISQIYEAGHEIGTHSQTHKRLTQLTAASVEQELTESATAIHRHSAQSVAYFRPPYGALDEALAKRAHELGLTVVTWNVDPRDWDTADPQKIVSEVLRQVRPGSIILLHEGKQQTLQALPMLIEQLRQAGYSFGTISDLFDFNQDTSPDKPAEPVIMTGR